MGAPDDRDGDGDSAGRELRAAVLAMQEQHAQGRASLLQLAGTVYALVDVLERKGLLSRAELAAAHAEAQGRVDKGARGRRRLYVLNEDRGDKYAPHPGSDVDCEARLPLCKAVCCTLQVPLSEQDLEEGAARWDVARPFFLQKDADRRCCHQDRASGGCTIYAARPLTCRSYTCAGDRRIWRDFDGRIPNEKGIAALLQQESRRSPALMGVAGELPDPAE